MELALLLELLLKKAFPVDGASFCRLYRKITNCLFSVRIGNDVRERQFVPSLSSFFAAGFPHVDDRQCWAPGDFES
jgi:hypothetical protein